MKEDTQVPGRTVSTSESCQVHLTEEERRWFNESHQAALTISNLGMYGGLPSPLVLLRRLAKAREKLAAVQHYTDELAIGHENGSWQALVKWGLDAILEVKDE